MRLVGRTSSAVRIALGAAILVCAFLTHGMADPTFPPLTGRVVDDAGILSPATRARLTAMLAQEEQKTGDQVVVVTLKSLQGYTIEDYGYRLGRHWGIGQKGKNNGALLLIAPNDRHVRIEVGYGLEGQLTDAQSRIIIERAILPAFRRGDYDAGVLAGTAAILDVLGGVQVTQAVPAAQGSAGTLPAGMLIWLAFFVLFILFRGFFWPLLFMPMGPWGSGGGLYGRSGIGGGFTGGGFSGGGGSFGGGGASGGW
ncbi:MAG: TPM domain-containing protein [Stellaceae bacterium]